jgi:glycosyltransferase involved in cell wall biosynthesis
LPDFHLRKLATSVHLDILSNAVMQSTRKAVFLINLVQDVNILRPLVYMATRDFGLDALLLVSTKFTGRDLFGIWQRELEQICAETAANLRFFSSDWEVNGSLTGEGLIFAASESHLPNHVTTHSIFRHAPASFLKVTLQHGFECVGFRHSADHVRAHGPTASFGADIVCAWQAPEHLISMSRSQRSKLLVTGPTAVLQMPVGKVKRESNAPGIICENLHSVRLNGAGDFKTEFVGAFDEFCRLLIEIGGEVVLRPHPGGQYVLKNKVPLPPNARINNAPMYRVDLREFGYGISAPSSVLIDMLLAGIPTAVWRDNAGGMDADNYAGLTTVSSPRDWLEFSKQAAADPESFLEIQRRFLERQAMPLEPQEVFTRYSELFQTARRMEVRPAAFSPERERILFVANANVPTLQLSFEKPLAPLVARGEITIDLLTEQELRDQPGVLGDEATETAWIERRLDAFDPSILIFCRYSGPASGAMIGWARKNNIPIIYHIDDDLLAIPAEIGQRKFELHNAPERLSTVRSLLTSANLVYASTENLRQRLMGYFPTLRIVSGHIYCSGSVLRRPAAAKMARKVGYMASADHAHNLQMVLGAIERLLELNPHVQFELFGSIAVPAELKRFGDRVTTALPIADYTTFLQEFAGREWDVGICPLVPIDFNLMKANTKWVEYTSCGAAVIASRGTVYDECCADSCGILAATEEEWLSALDHLVNDDEARLAMIHRAQDKLEREYHIGRLRDQVLDVISKSRETASLQLHEFQQENSICQTA